MGFEHFTTAPAPAGPDTAFDRLDALAPDAAAVTLQLVQGDQMTVRAGGALTVEESPHAWTVAPPARRNLVVTLLRPGAAVDPNSGEAVDRITRRQLPQDCALVLPRPANAERLTVDNSRDKRGLAVRWDNSSPLDDHDWGMSR